VHDEAAELGAVAPRLADRELDPDRCFGLPDLEVAPKVRLTQKSVKTVGPAVGRVTWVS